MKHELTLTDGGLPHVNEDFGVIDEKYEMMIDNISLELYHALVFRNDDRSKSQCLIDVLSTLEPEEFGISPTTANHYFMIGLAFAKAMAMVDTIEDTFTKKAMDDLPGLMHRLMERGKHRDEIKSTTGSVN